MEGCEHPTLSSGVGVCIYLHGQGGAPRHAQRLIRLTSEIKLAVITLHDEVSSMKIGDHATIVLRQLPLNLDAYSLTCLPYFATIHYFHNLCVHAQCKNNEIHKSSTHPMQASLSLLLLLSQVPGMDGFEAAYTEELPDTFGVRQGLVAYDAIRQLLQTGFLLPDSEGNVVIGVYGHREGAISAQLLASLLHTELDVRISFMVGGQKQSTTHTGSPRCTMPVRAASQSDALVTGFAQCTMSSFPLASA